MCGGKGICKIDNRSFKICNFAEVCCRNYKFFLKNRKSSPRGCVAGLAEWEKSSNFALIKKTSKTEYRQKSQYVFLFKFRKL